MISICCKIPIGYTAQEAFTEALGLSQRMDVVVEFVFKDRLWSVRPDDEFNEVLLQYFETLAQRKWDEPPSAYDVKRFEEKMNLMPMKMPKEDVKDETV